METTMEQGKKLSILADDEDTSTYLILGDGDFTFSLDLARYLLVSNKKMSTKRIRMVATGFDSKEELLSKYRDAPFILKQLNSILQNNNNNSNVVAISTHHGINAIVPLDIDSRVDVRADRVLFQHPHLGTEDASLHSKFLCHFFHSCTHYWMKPKRSSLLHLTLVKGQFERWKCEKAALRQGLVLLDRRDFQPPPVALDDKNDNKPYYQLRRHQSGKSFNSRRPDSSSETFTFGRQSESKNDCDGIPLAWQKQQKEQNITTTASSTATTSSPKDDSTTQQPKQLQMAMTGQLPCLYCDRLFREERSRKNHVRDKHPDGVDKRQRLGESSSSLLFTCQHCCSNSEIGQPRSFPSEQALKDHVRAKHVGVHRTKILPDWHHQPTTTTESKDTEKESLGKIGNHCSICGTKYRDENHRTNHLQDFVPLEAKDSFLCSFCSKVFRENRARLQHENFCSKRNIEHP